jgi:hypothetical protein
MAFALWWWLLACLPTNQGVNKSFIVTSRISLAYRVFWLAILSLFAECQGYAGGGHVDL